MELKFNPTNRKALAKAAAEILGTQAKYQGVATMAYQIGELTLRRDGTLEGELPFGLLTALAERGFEPEPSSTFHLITPRGTLLCQKRYDTREDAEADGYSEYFHHEGRDVYIKQNPDGATEHSKLFAVVGASFEKAEPVPEPAIDGVCIEYPRASMSDEAIENLRRMVAAKAPLIKMALGAEELPIEVLPDRLAFDWFSAENDNGQIDCWVQFISCLCRTAAIKKRVTAQEREFVNPRYQMRCFLLALNMIGPEYAETRKLLIANLPGCSGWLVPPEKTPAAQGETPATPAAEAEEAPEAAEESEVGEDE
ncbi:MAG: hypothetical protein LBG83_03300 [Oscillospiraceae bacterium]|jgi:hypothetical protein|nr:hypothetical protein [Oscillospiraceae bacterium]